MSEKLATAVTGLKELRDATRNALVCSIQSILAGRIQKIVSSGELEAIIKQNINTARIATVTEISNILTHVTRSYILEVLGYMITRDLLKYEEVTFTFMENETISVTW